jgi:hypothetical protein
VTKKGEVVEEEGKDQLQKEGKATMKKGGVGV